MRVRLLSHVVVCAHVVEDKIEIDNPTQNLESYFLGVVAKARASEEATSGATSGSRVAEYLREGGEEAPQIADKEKLLDRLTTVEAVAEKPAPAAPTAEENAQQKKLDTLSEAAPVAAPKPSPSAEAKKVEAENQVVSEKKLNDLLGGD